MIELLLPYGFDTLEYSWVKATIGIYTIADYLWLRNTNNQMSNCNAQTCLRKADHNHFRWILILQHEIYKNLKSLGKSW
jgi:hypothetical protein